jgi:selenocysteine lyase/cysteine desulfurase
MHDLVSRRALIGALGAGALLPSLGGAQTYAAAAIPAGSRELWQWLAAQLVLDPRLTWLDTAGFGPALNAVMVREYRSRERQSLDFRAYQAAVLDPEPLAARLGDVADFIGAAPDEVTFTHGALAGLRLVARGLDLQPGDEVLAGSHERPAVLGAWRTEAARHGWKLVELPQAAVPESPAAIVGRYAGAITARTRVLLVSHVQATDGTVMPLRELCALARANGALSIVDGALGPGHVELRVGELGCDVYAAAFHRWSNAGWGTGALYLRREVQPRIWPTTGVANDASGAQARYGTASRQLGPAIAGLGAALDLQRTLTFPRIGARIRELAAYLRLQLTTLPGVEIVTPANAALNAGILSLRLPRGEHTAVAAGLADDDGIVVGVVQQGAFDALRLSVHPGNDHDQLDRCVSALRRRL